MRPLVEAMRERTGDLRFLAILLALFAVVAVGLATLGVYGLVSYIVAQLRRDFGIRLALGATSRQLTARMLLWVGRLAFAAVFAGLLMATLLTPLLQGRLFQIAPRDGVTFVAASIIVLALAMLAAGIPALRAARTDPRVALTSE
jgi:ABC-type antimicrobial peptide transport system permease subunit